MSAETLKDPQIAEVELQRILEVYQQSPLGTLETYAYYGVDGTQEAADARSNARQHFMDGTIRNPKLYCPYLENYNASKLLSGFESTVLYLMKDSVNLDYDTDRELALYDNLRLRYLEVAMLQISRTLATDETLTDDKRAELTDMFNTANDEVYGYLDANRFNGLLSRVYEKAKQLNDDVNTPETIREAATYILTNSELQDSGKKPIRVSQHTLETLKDLVLETNSDILACVPEKPENEKLTSEELVETFERAHAVRETGWQVRTQKGKENIDTRQSEKTTYIGEERPLSTELEAAQILLHENGIHVERRKQGDLLGDPLLSGTGLVGYLDAEEGFATLIEEIYEGKTQEHGVQYYLTLGWARGLDGKSRDFRDVYELERRRQLIEEYQENPDAFSEDDKKTAQNLAYYTCERIFRGTPCNIPGMVYTKDQAYFVGSQKMGEYLENIVDLPKTERRAAFSRIFRAKFDPTNELHNRLVGKALTEAV